MSEDTVTSKIGKTMAVLGGVNLLLTPLLVCDSTWALLSCIAVNTWLIIGLHEIGRSSTSDEKKESQKVSVSFFELTPAQEFDSELIEKAAGNIIAGGATVCRYL